MQFSESETKVFQFIEVSNTLTDKIIAASWCCQDHRRTVSDLLISMNESVIESVKKHGVSELSSIAIMQIDTFLDTLQAIEKTIDEMDDGAVTTMPHGGIA